MFQFVIEGSNRPGIGYFIYLFIHTRKKRNASDSYLKGEPYPNPNRPLNFAVPRFSMKRIRVSKLCMHLSWSS